MNGFWGLPLALIVLILLAGMIAAYEAGRLAHRKLDSARGDGTGGSSDEGYILSGAFGLLALLMAFAFSMALNRYENRRELMMQESNAISSFDLMADALRQPISDQLRAQLRPYAQARLTVSTSEGAARLRALEQSAALRASLEASVRQAMRAHEGTPPAVAIGQAYDMLSDAAANRDALAVAHLPERVLALLAAFCIVSATMLGYAVAAERGGHRIASGVLFLLFALSFGAILDLDRPRSGAITVSQEPLRQAVDDLH